MSRTWRNAPRSAFRRPRGNRARRAVMETLDGEIVPVTRPRAVPPDAGERFSSREVNGAVARYLLNAWLDGHGLRRMVRRAERRFGLSYPQAHAAMKAAVERSGMPENGAERRPYRTYIFRDRQKIPLDRIPRVEVERRIYPWKRAVDHIEATAVSPVEEPPTGRAETACPALISSPSPRPSSQGFSWPVRLSSPEPSLQPLQARPSSRREQLSWWRAWLSSAWVVLFSWLSCVRSASPTPANTDAQQL